MARYRRLFLYVTITAKLLVLLVLGLSTVKFIDASNSVYLGERITDVSHKIIVTVIGAESSQRGYIITDDPSYLAAYNYAVTSLDYQLNDLNLSASASGTAFPQVADITTVAHEKMDELFESIKLRNTESFDAAQALVKKDIGEKLRQKLFTLLNQVIDHEKIRTDHFETIIRWTGFIIIGGLVLFSCLAILTALITKAAFDYPEDPENDPV